MGRSTVSLPPAYFDERYGKDPDPWRFETSAYEHQKYAATLDALPDPTYGSGVEIGCSIGVLTRGLAGRCGALLGLDVAEGALRQAQERCRDLPHVRFARMVVPGQWPEGRFDLIVLSEVVYYLDRSDVCRLADRIETCLAQAGTVLLVHWTGPTDYPLSGDEAADLFVAHSAPFAGVATAHTTDHYRLDRLCRRA